MWIHGIFYWLKDIGENRNNFKINSNREHRNNVKVYTNMKR